MRRYFGCTSSASMIILIQQTCATLSMNQVQRQNQLRSNLWYFLILSPLTLDSQIKFVIFLTLDHTILRMLVWRI